MTDLLYIFNGTATLETDPVEPSSYPDDVRRCKRALTRFWETCGGDFLENLFRFLQRGREERRNTAEGSLKELASFSLFLPARVFVYLATEIEGQPFWELWLDWKDKIYHDEQIKQYDSRELQEQREKWRKEPFPKIRTFEYLKQDDWFTFEDTPEKLKGKGNYCLTDDDRLFWWDGTDEVILSDTLAQWLKDLAARHIKLMELPNAGYGDAFGGPDFLKNFIFLLDDICNYYQRIYPFQAMFYDFLQHFEEKE